jgi:hypothetical protein
MPGWKMAARLWVVILLTSDLAAKTASKSRIYNSSWRFRDGKPLIKCWYMRTAASGSNPPVDGDWPSMCPTASA